MDHESGLIGILGLGFLGKELAGLTAWKEGSWGSWHSSPVTSCSLDQFHFDWQDSSSWSGIPKLPVVMVLTIPPPALELEVIAEQLRQWKEWMQEKRPMLQRLILISTTGVYPKQEGIWSEDSNFDPDSDSGKRRLLVEQELSEGFQLQVIRPGGIYGPGRNLLERLKSGKSIPDTGTPTHRIHVHDLARITENCILHPHAKLINAVDDEPCPSRDVVQWLLEYHPEARGIHPVFPPQTEKPLLQRRISKHRLEALGISLEYPTFREGML